MNYLVLLYSICILKISYCDTIFEDSIFLFLRMEIIYQLNAACMVKGTSHPFVGPSIFFHFFIFIVFLHSLSPIPSFAYALKILKYSSPTLHYFFQFWLLTRTNFDCHFRALSNSWWDMPRKQKKSGPDTTIPSIFILLGK